jgi:hypothetical protein
MEVNPWSLSNLISGRFSFAGYFIFSPVTDFSVIGRLYVLALSTSTLFAYLYTNLVSAFPLTVFSCDCHGFGNFTLPDDLSYHLASCTVFSVAPGSVRSFTCFGTASYQLLLLRSVQTLALNLGALKIIRFLPYGAIYTIILYLALMLLQA